MQLLPSSRTLTPHYPRQALIVPTRIHTPQRAAALVGVAAACVTAAATAHTEPLSDPIEAHRRGANEGSSEDDGQRDDAHDDDTPIRLAGDVVPARRALIEASFNTRFFSIGNGFAAYAGGEITTGLMIRYFELLLRVAVEVALVEPTQAPNMRAFGRHDILVGTNIELRRRLIVHIRAGPRIILFKGFGGVLSTGISFHPRRRLLISLFARGMVGAQYLQWETETEELVEEREFVWGLGLNLSVGLWI